MKERIERQRAEAYARIWRRYDHWEINIQSWKRRSDGVWTADAKYLRFVVAPAPAASAPARSGGAAPAGGGGGGNLPQLVGVIQTSGSAIFQVGGSSASAAVGETIGSSGWRLRSANGDSAVIERGGEQRQVSLSSGFERPAITADPTAKVAVDCASLKVSTKFPYQSWGSWQRPAEGHGFEKLLVDRCTQ